MLGANFSSTRRISSSICSSSTLYLRTLVSMNPPIRPAVPAGYPSSGHSVPQVGSEQRQRIAADLDQARDGARPDLLLERRLVEVGGDDDRALRLVALVDHRVELFQDPVAAPLYAEVVDVQ